MNLEELNVAIAAAEADFPELAPTLEYHKELQAAMANVEAKLPRVSLTVSEPEVEINLKGGAPISVLETVPVDPELFGEAFEAALEVYWKHQEGKSDQAAAVARVTWPYEEIVKQFFSQDLSGLLDLAKQHEVNPQLFAYLVMTAMRPFFHGFAGSLGKYVNADWWKQSRCPVCGQKGTMARLDREGRRLLVCPLCDFEWQVKRVGCIHCGNDDLAQMHELTAEELPGYQVHACDKCKGYLKVVDQRETIDQGIDLFLADLLSQELDQVADKRGYVREPHTAN